MQKKDRSVPDGYLPSSFFKCGYSLSCPEEGVRKKGKNRGAYCLWHYQWNSYHPRAKLIKIEALYGRIGPPSSYIIDGNGMPHLRKV